MPFIKTNCPTCNKPFESVKEFQLSDVTAHFGKCGHVLKGSQLAHKDTRAIESLDGKKLFKFQAEGVDFLETANGRALIADEMGLGKTVQVLGFFVLHPEALKALYVVKKSLTTQWQHENMRWIGENEFAQIISDSKTDLLPFAKYYIISYDLVSRIKDFKEKCEQAGVKTIVLDECQQIKNPEANRSVAIRSICRAKSIEHIIALSGTPIKNRASEYFTVLNILHPEIFSNLAGFTRWWCQSYWDGHKYVTGGLANPELFKEKTKSFIIRREHKDIKDQLPTATDPITRRFSFHELGKEVEAAYVETFKSFLDEYNSESNGMEKEMNKLAYLSKMRYLTGLSKIDPCIDHVMEFLGSTDRKMLIFVHHKDVGEILKMRLDSLMTELGLEGPVQFRAGDSSQEFIAKFAKGSRIGIVSTLAGGEGMDGIQKFCSDLVLLERQWNPANEEQAEKRISQRIGQNENVTGTYFVAVGTVDEFFSEIVEKKRQYVTQTLGGEAPDWDESSLIKELSEILATRGGQRWGL